MRRSWRGPQPQLRDAPRIGVPRRPRPSTGRHGGAAAELGPKPLRIGPRVYLVQTQPGFEGVAWSEINARYAGSEPHNRADGPRSHPGVRELGRRMVPDRAGMTIFTAPRLEPLLHLRSAEDLFAVIAYRHDLSPELATLERVRAAARGARWIGDTLAAHVSFVPGSRAGRRLRFRVVARTTGDHEFRRVDFQRAIARGISERGDHSWRLDEAEADLELWATLLGGELLLTVRLSDDRMRQREYKIVHLPGSLRPSVGAALAWLAEPEPNDIVLDPMCGAGTILIERAHLARYRNLIGSDRDAEARAAAASNIGERYKPIALEAWDATALPLGAASIDKLVTNMPWGVRHGTHAENRRLYPALLAEFKRVTRPGGLVVMLSGETSLMSTLMAQRVFRPEKILRVTILGANAAVYVWRV